MTPGAVLECVTVRLQESKVPSYEFEGTGI